MNYKLVAFDLDGTLLNSKHRISENTLEIIKMLKSMGVCIVIATGRSFNACIYYGKLIQADYIIACNGAFTYDRNNKNISNKLPLNKALAKKVLDILYNYSTDLKIQWDSISTYYSNNITPFEKDYINNYLQDFPEETFNFKIIEKKEEIENFNQEIYQIFFHPMGENMSIYKKVLYDIQKYSGLNVVDFKENYTDLNHHTASKGKGLQQIAKKLDIKKDKIMVFGDGNNDLSMFKYAGFSVAMDNANEEIKQIANHITRCNDDEGVKKALAKMFNLNDFYVSE